MNPNITPRFQAVMDSFTAESLLPSGLWNLKSNPPGAEIYRENQLLGITPVKVKFRQGSFEVKLALEGYAMATVESEARR